MDFETIRNDGDERIATIAGTGRAFWAGTGVTEIPDDGSVDDAAPCPSTVQEPVVVTDDAKQGPRAFIEPCQPVWRRR